VDGIVSSVVYEYLAKFLEENPKDASKIMKKVILAAEAREAAQKAKKALKDRKSILNSGGLPGKLMDCTTRERDESELFLVEGQSAGGSADNGRNRHFQAILPLRGKVLNVEKARLEKVLDNAELISLISAIGIDIGNTEDLEGLRYGKIILLTDADVDGQHIRTLLLTFFYRQMQNLIKANKVFVARPPLFKVEFKKHSRYVQTLAEMNSELLDRGLEGTRLHVLPPEGSKDQPAIIEGDGMKPLLVLLDELENSLTILERRGLNIATLLGRIKEGKLPTFRVLLGNQEHWFFTDAEVDQFRLEQVNAGRQLVVADEDAQPNGHGELFSFQELHEIKSVNRALEKMRASGLVPTDLVPAPRIAGREPVLRFELEHEAKKQPLAHLRVLVAEIRKIGERGMKVKRFKGLGEMDGDELWETTLNPEARTLVQVQLEDALKAENMFRTLMGEKVEPRREFIQKHALEVKEIDYHGA
jgi:DNA gyrase subunit B